MDAFSLDNGLICKELKLRIVQSRIHQICQRVLDGLRISPHDLCQVSLRVVIHKKDTFSRSSQGGAQIGAGGCLSNTAF